MFFHKKPAIEASGGSEKRYAKRIDLFTRSRLAHPHLAHHAHWLLHNCVVHPAVGVLPCQETVELHGLSSAWLSRIPGWVGVDEAEMPVIPSGPKARAYWLLHNVVAHVAIGLAPCGPTFTFHDWTAKKMNVEGWV